MTIEDPISTPDDLVAKAKKSTLEVESPLKFKFFQMQKAVAVSLPTGQTLVFAGVIIEPLVDDNGDSIMQEPKTDSVERRCILTLQGKPNIPGGELGHYKDNKTFVRSLLLLGPFAASMN